MSKPMRVVREYVQRGHVEKNIGTTPIAAKKMRVAAYCRVSTKEDDQLNSYEAQVNYYTQYISSKPEWDFVGIYADEGITGTKLRRRKEFNRLISDALDGKINLIIVKSVSRFARNTVDSLSTVRDLREKGVKIFFEKENIDSLDSKCDMVLSIYSSLAEEESRSISTNIRWRWQKQVEAGEVSYNFNLLYGYRQDENKKVAIYKPEAEVIQDIYFKFLIGYTYREIIRDFKERGVEPPNKTNKSGLWQTSTIKSILENEKYMGDVILQKTYTRDFLSERRVLNIGQAPQKYVENNHPAIIDRTTWNAVQAEMERRANLRTVEKSGKGRYSGQYAFSGKIECGCCGAGYRRHHQHGNRAWVCKQHIKKSSLCPALPIRENVLEAAFVRTLNDIIQNHDRIIEVVGTAVNEALAEAGEELDRNDELIEIDGQIETLQARILELNKQRGKREIDAEQYNTESREVMTKLDALFIERDLIAEQRNTATLSKAFQEVVAEFLSKAGAQAEFDRDIFARLVDKIIVKSRENIIFVLKDGTEVKTVLSDAI
ncbi:MAG: recombinase family protein [Clostridia bacterium]|nr:recombinase family protein [Clostridia bacterium]